MAFNIARYKDIEEKSYEIEVITPMFLGGANPKSAELRVPPFKGMLRFWWRAINSHLVKNGDFSNLLENESKIFGDSNKYGKSKVKISIESNEFNPDSFNPLPHKDVKFKFSAIPVGYIFKLNLISPFEIHDLFKFVSIVGSVGKRARRGFGSFTIKNEELPNDNILEYINNLLKSITHKNNYSVINNTIILNKEERSAEYPYLKKISLGKESDNYKQLLRLIGKSSHNNNSDYTGYFKNINRKGYRLASPIYVTMMKQLTEYKIIISELNVASNLKMGSNKSEQFIKDLR